ncbi:MAG: efflux transporter periplasmic adaptor subunit [Rhodospirillales bacterium]|nr:efflux transporter periplasmic adaptor subunit [Rhodospirillales bacterium]
MALDHPRLSMRSFSRFAVASVLAWAFVGGAFALAQGGPPPVTVSPPLKKSVVEWDEYTGQFTAVDSVEIRARVSGYLTEIHFQDGQFVKQGDLLLVIDPRPFEIARDSAQAQLAQAQAKLELANRQLQRTTQLRQSDFAPASTFDERQQAMRDAAAGIDASKAALRSAELDLEFSHITAPLTGRVGRHEVSIGNLVTGGAGGGTTLLTTIVSLDPIHFIFDMSEADFLSYQRAVASGKLGSTRDGKLPAEVRLTDEKTWTRRGVLDFVDNQIDRSAGTIRARALFPNPDNFVTPGQFGRLRLPGSEPYEALLVPDAAIVTDQSRKIVMVVKDDGTVEARVVRPGPIIDGLRVVRDGLKAEDRIVIDGLMRARAGAKVTPQPGKIEPDPQAS